MEAIHRKSEQVFDAVDQGTITGKQAEQMNMAIKGLWKSAEMELKYWSLVAKLGKNRNVPVPRTPLLRSTIGLTLELRPTDGAFVRGETDVE